MQIATKGKAWCSLSSNCSLSAMGAIHDWGTTFGTKGIKDCVTLDLAVYYDLLLFDQ